MFNIYVNDETCNEIIINFEGIAEDAPHYLDDCYDYIDRAKKHHYIKSDQINSYQDYHFAITFEDDSKDEMYKCEKYLYSLFDELEHRIQEELEEQEEREEGTEDMFYNVIFL